MTIDLNEEEAVVLTFAQRARIVDELRELWAANGKDDDELADIIEIVNTPRAA